MKLTDAQIYTLRRMAKGTKYQAQGDGKRARELRYHGDVNAPSIPVLIRRGLVCFVRKVKPDCRLYHAVTLTEEGRKMAKEARTFSERIGGTDEKQ